MEPVARTAHQLRKVVVEAVTVRLVAMEETLQQAANHMGGHMEAEAAEEDLLLYTLAAVGLAALMQ